MTVGGGQSLSVVATVGATVGVGNGVGVSVFSDNGVGCIEGEDWTISEIVSGVLVSLRV